MSDDQCRICGSDGDRSVYAAGERMFGTGEVFHYAECSQCGWLQLLDVPEDLAPYYPNDYYSFGNPPPVDGRFERMAKTIRTELVLRGPEWGTRMLPMSWRPGWREWFRGVIPSRSAPIIDVGSGSGRVLTFLHNDGFTNLVGYDPFLESEKATGPVPLYRQVPDKFWGTFALAMMHHSLEHAMDPFEALDSARRLIRPDGWVLVRIPLADSFAWKHYRTDWIALDPPRHISLLTETALGLLAKAVGLTVVRTHRDSDALQFWGSEQLRLGIVLEDERSLSKNPRASIFSDDEMAAFSRQAATLNASGQGDTGCFLLRPTAR